MRSPLLIKIQKVLRALGPGLITGASDDDPSGIATYSQAGAGFGFSTLWTALITFPLMASIQEMCARVGIVTQSGLTGTIKKHYPKWLVYMMLIFSFPAITLNIGADIQGMGAVAHMLVPQVPIFAFCFIFTGLLIFVIIRYPYEKISAVLKWLCMVLLLYIAVPYFIKLDWKSVLHHTVVPSVHFNKSFIEILVAILGTTISPYLFFWQATMEAEDIAHAQRKIIVNKRFMEKMETDVYSGMLLSNLVMFFVILTTGAVLYTANIRQIDTVEQAAKALQPLAGKFTYYLFAIGIIGTGMLAIPVLAGSLSYILTETMGWNGGLDLKFHNAKGFYITIIISLILGLGLDLLGISPVNALIYTAILYGITSPPMIAVVMHICNSKKIMGEFTNGKLSNIMGLLTLILMTASAVALIYFQFT